MSGVGVEQKCSWQKVGLLESDAKSRKETRGCEGYSQDFDFVLILTFRTTMIKFVRLRTFRMRPILAKRLMVTQPPCHPEFEKKTPPQDEQQQWRMSWGTRALVIGAIGLIAATLNHFYPIDARTARIRAFKLKLLEKATLNRRPSSQTLPRFEGLFPEYDYAFKTLAQILLVEGASGIGKSIKTYELLQEYKGPVFYHTFLSSSGDASEAVCAAAGVRDLQEFEEGIRLASEEAGAPVIIALDDVHLGYGKSATATRMAPLLGYIRSKLMYCRGLYLSAEENVVSLIAKDGQK